MAHRYTRSEVESLAAAVGLHMDTYSPGDGITRYRFSPEDGCYFSMANINSFTALGISQAVLAIQAYRIGNKQNGAR